MDTKAENLKSAAFSLEKVHKGAAQLRHGIWNYKIDDWDVFFPSHFIYSFLAFNSLYNVDWFASYDSRRIITIPKVQKRTQYGYKLVDDTEGNKQEKYLSFCFRDSHFVELYKEFFIKCVLRGNSVSDIQGILMKIQLDGHSNGAVRTEQYVNRFRGTVDDLLCRNRFKKENIATILDFLYSIRCNLFHGVKSVDEIIDYRQQDRFDVYASIIISLNQMVFSYLEYLIKGDSFTEQFGNLYKQLMT